MTFQTYTRGRFTTLLGCGLAFVIAMPLATSAGEQTPISAVKVNKGGKFELILDDKKAGRMVYFFSFHAVNKALKGGNLVDGVVNTGGGFADTTNGLGHISGFDVNEKDGDIWKAGWAGECFGVAGSDGKPVPHCSGGWSVVPESGSGRFAGLSGGGE